MMSFKVETPFGAVSVTPTEGALSVSASGSGNEYRDLMFRDKPYSMYGLLLRGADGRYAEWRMDKRSTYGPEQPPEVRRADSVKFYDSAPPTYATKIRDGVREAVTAWADANPAQVNAAEAAWLTSKLDNAKRDLAQHREEAKKKEKEIHDTIVDIRTKLYGVNSR